MKAKKLVIDLIETVEANEDNKLFFINILNLPLSAMRLYKKMLKNADKQGKGTIKISELLEEEVKALKKLKLKREE